jgi:hypothetical protein
MPTTATPASHLKAAIHCGKPERIQRKSDINGKSKTIYNKDGDDRSIKAANSQQPTANS